MYAGEEVEASIGRYNDRVLLLNNPEILPTLLSVQLRTTEIICKDLIDWNGIACTAKTGGWLASKEYIKAIKRKGNVKIAMVVCDTGFELTLKTNYWDELIGHKHVGWIPWWKHNNNTTIFLKDAKPIAAIVFERRMRTAMIAPLFLTEPQDVQWAWNLFAAYWLKSGGSDGETEIRSVKSSDLYKAKGELFELFS
jgi:hypothetical protein